MRRTFTAISSFTMAYVMLSICIYSWNIGTSPRKEAAEDEHVYNITTVPEQLDNKPPVKNELYTSYVDNGTFHYALPRKNFSPQVQFHEVPINYKPLNESSTKVDLTTIYDHFDSDGDPKKHPLNSVMNYCMEPTSLAEREASYPRKMIPPTETVPIPPEIDTQQPKKILFWNPFFEQGDYHIGLRDDMFRYCRCPRLCWLSMDHADLDSADAVIIHTFYLRPQSIELPPRKNLNQIFVFFLLENPVVTWDGMADYDYYDVFNLTMTYLDHPGTDIYIPAGDIRKRLATTPYTMPTLDSVQDRSEPVAWLVSNCASYSERDAYFERLGSFITIDIFGKCGKFSCPLGDDWGYTCMKNLTKKYHFYIAAENTFCDGYITEKVFKTMFFDMVPIVYGGGNYSKVLPKDSFIDVRDFSSPNHLANYLNHLIENPSKYLEYFRWKQDKMVVADDYHRARGICKLCNILNDPTYVYKSHFDLVSYWNPDKLCRRGKDEREEVHLTL